jgi:hypothetical protein
MAYIFVKNAIMNKEEHQIKKVVLKIYPIVIYNMILFYALRVHRDQTQRA